MRVRFEHFLDIATQLTSKEIHILGDFIHTKDNWGFQIVKWGIGTLIEKTIEMVSYNCQIFLDSLNINLERNVY